MATSTKYFLRKVKVDNVVRDLIAASDGDNVAVIYEGSEVTLSAALAAILTKIGTLPTSEAMSSAINTELSKIIAGAPEAGDTLKELYDLITTNGEADELLRQAVTNKVDKVEGYGLSKNDFTDAFKTALESLSALNITAEKVQEWDAKASTAVATSDKNGLMSKEDKVKLDGLHGVYVGATVPDDLENGTLIVELETEGNEGE